MFSSPLLTISCVHLWFCGFIYKCVVSFLLMLFHLYFFFFSNSEMLTQFMNFWFYIVCASLYFYLSTFLWVLIIYVWASGWRMEMLYHGWQQTLGWRDKSSYSLSPLNTLSFLERNFVGKFAQHKIWHCYIYFTFAIE